MARKNIIWLLLFFCVQYGHAQKESSHLRPNILFILVDDMGWRDLGCYGSFFYESPNIDRLAAQGIRYTDAYAFPVCAPTRSAILTGKNPARKELTNWRNTMGTYAEGKPWNQLLQPNIEYYLDLNELSVAEALKQSGYATFFAGKWHVGEDESLWPEHQGFDFNKGGNKSGSPYYRKYDNDTDTWSGESGYFSPYKNPRLTDGPVGENLTDRLTNETIAFLKQNKEKPFFAYLSYHVVHNPLHGKPELVNKFKEKAKRLGLDTIQTFVFDKEWMIPNPEKINWKERMVQSNTEYAAMIHGLDENIGRIMQALEDAKLDKNTLVVFTSDNGGLSTQEGSATSNLPLRGGKGWIYEGGIRVPLIMRWTEHIKNNQVSHEPIVCTDFYPTFLKIAGLPLLPKQHLDGVEVTPTWDMKKLRRQALYWYLPHYYQKGGRPAAAIRLGNYKLIQHFDPAKIELFDLSMDIGETKDVAKQFPKKVKEMNSLLTNWIKKANVIPMPVNPNYKSDYRATAVGINK